MHWNVLAALAAATLACSAVAQEKRVITSADQMPRREYAIPKLPSELVAGPRDEVEAVAAQVDKDLANDLATLDIRDRATRVSMLSTRAAIAMHRGDWAAVEAFMRDIRSQQESPPTS